MRFYTTKLRSEANEYYPDRGVTARDVLKQAPRIRSCSFEAESVTPSEDDGSLDDSCEGAASTSSSSNVALVVPTTSARVCARSSKEVSCSPMIVEGGLTSGTPPTGSKQKQYARLSGPRAGVSRKDLGRLDEGVQLEQRRSLSLPRPNTWPTPTFRFDTSGPLYM